MIDAYQITNLGKKGKKEFPQLFKRLPDVQLGYVANQTNRQKKRTMVINIWLSSKTITC